MEEQWRPINERYEVSNFGNIRSYVDFHGKIGTVPHLLKPHKGNNGYYMIMLYFKNKHKYMPVHRLVATAFIPNPNNYRCVNHKDENKLNNSVDNLEWCTHKYNCNYGTRNGKIKDKLGKPVYQTNKEGKIIKYYKSISEAAKSMNRSVTCIYDCCIGKQKTCAGVYWKF